MILPPTHHSPPPPMGVSKSDPPRPGHLPPPKKKKFWLRLCHYHPYYVQSSLEGFIMDNKNSFLIV